MTETPPEALAAIDEHLAPTDRPPVEHDLKCWPASFRECLARRKRAELRRMDRDFRVGDRIRLREYRPDKGQYTGSWAVFQVTHVLVGPSPHGLADGYAMLSLIGPIVSLSPPPR